VGRERAIAFTLSGFFMGIGGGLFAQFQGTITPQALYLLITFWTIAMLVVGGMTSLSGAVIGVVVLSTLAEFLRRVEQGVHLGFVDIPARSGVREVGLGIVMLGILLARPTGITGGKEIHWPFGKHQPYQHERSRAEAPVPADP
jgi:branched-chain amino acid transport system permease protein